jgi:hypothetical protein
MLLQGMIDTRGLYDLVAEPPGGAFDRRSDPDRRSNPDRLSPCNRFSSSDRVSTPLRRSWPARLSSPDRLSSSLIVCLRLLAGRREIGDDGAEGRI